MLAAEDDLGGPYTSEYARVIDDGESITSKTIERCSGYSTRMLLLTDWMGQELRAIMDPQRPDDVFDFAEYLMNNLSVNEVMKLFGNKAELQEAVARFNAKSSKKKKERHKKNGASRARS